VRTKDLCWSMRTIYDPREPLGVSTVSLGVVGVLQMECGFTDVWATSLGIWHMAHVGLEWSHDMVYDDTRHTDVARGEVPGLGLTNEDVGLLREVDCDILAPLDGDILAQDLIELIEYSYQQGASSFSEACLKRTFGLSVLGLEQSWVG
jgi:hypothetical protein